ncbi:MAG: tetratricopeptide repeat protein [Lysobacterales bacterium]
MSFFNELKRRDVIRVGSAYVVFSWLIVQVVETLFPVYGFSDEAIRNVILVLAIGFVPALLISWVFEVTPDGVRLQSVLDAQGIQPKPATKTFDRIIMLVLIVALAFFAFDKFFFDPERDRENLEAAREEAEVEVLAELAEERSRELAEILPNSVAVMLFDNQSPDPEDAYFADGIHESIVNELARISDINVIARTSMQRYRGTDWTIEQVAKELRVGTVMLGGVRYAGDRVRISAQLIDPRTELQIWAVQYDRDFVDIFAIQSDIAERIAQELKTELLPSEQAMIGQAPTKSAKAYSAYLKAMALVRAGFRVASRPERRTQIQNLLDEALFIDPDFALAMAWKARVYIASRLYDPVTELEWPEFKTEMEQRVVTFAQQALERDPRSGMAFSALADLYAHNWAGERAVEAAHEAVLLEPNNPEVLVREATFATHKDQHAEAIRLMRHAVELDPNSGRVLHELGYALHAAKRFTQASEVLRRCLDFNPEEAICSVMLARSEFALGNKQRALSALRLTESLLPEDAAPGIRGEISWGYGLLGYPDEARRAFARVEEAAKKRYVDPTTEAWARMGLGQYDLALELLREAADDLNLIQDPYPAHFIRENSWSDPMLETSDFIEVRERLRL